MIDAPCHGCRKRKRNCHAECGAYADYSAKMEAQRKARYADSDFTAAIERLHNKAVKRTIR